MLSVFELHTCLISRNTNETTTFPKSHLPRVKPFSASATWSSCPWPPAPLRCGWFGRSGWSRRTRSRGARTRPAWAWRAAAGSGKRKSAICRRSGPPRSAGNRARTPTWPPATSAIVTSCWSWKKRQRAHSFSRIVVWKERDVSSLQTTTSRTNINVGAFERSKKYQRATEPKLEALSVVGGSTPELRLQEKDSS